MSSRNIFEKPEEIFHIGVKALVRNENGEVLLFEANTKGTPHWDLPGGRVQKNNLSIEDTLTREILEETGINNFKIIDLFDASISKLRIPFDQCDVALFLLVYECQFDNRNEIKISNEHLGYQWYKPKEAAELLKVKFPDQLVKKISSLV